MVSFAWRCLDCPWRSRARGPVAHEQVRIHHTVTGHALACRKIVDPASAAVQMSLLEEAAT